MSRYHDLTRILPDLHDEDFDAENRIEEHLAIFGHRPPAEGKCNHPMHDAIRRTMNGATIEVPFDGQEVISSDSEVERLRKERYDMIYQMTQDFQKQVEEEDKYQRMREAGLILPR